MATRIAQIGRMYRAAELAPSTVNADRRTVQVTWTTGARVLRGGMFGDPYWEELSLEPAHVRMERLQSGAAPVLDAHRAGGVGDLLGVVESAQLEADRGTAVVRFDRGASADDAFRKVRDGILRNVSVGYAVYRALKVGEDEDGIPIYRAIDWSPYELSMVPIGADAGAMTRAAGDTYPCEFIDENEERSMPENQNTDQADERERAAAITRVARVLGAPSERVEELIRTGVPLDQARARLIDESAERDTIHFARLPTSANAAYGGGTAAVGHRSIKLMAEALAARFGGPAPSDEARQYIHLSTVDFARHFLEMRGVNTRVLSKNQIIERSFIGSTTSDFPALLTETGNRVLRRGYDSYQGGLKRAAKQTEAPDFRPVSKLQLSEAPTLLKVLEHGEFTHGSMGEAKESYSIESFGRIFSLTRKAIVNDDLGAFTDMGGKLGRAAAEFEAVQLVKLLISNPTLAADGKPVFHADHGNLAASGGAPSVTTLGAALQAMRTQKGLDGVTAIDVQPKYLIVPAALETVGLQVIAQITPAQVANVNPFSGKLELIVEPRLDATSTTAWYLAADPGVIDGIEYAYLLGEPGPQMFIRQGFEIDGIEWKVRLDWGCAILDFRGLYRNPG